MGTHFTVTPQDHSRALSCTKVERLEWFLDSCKSEAAVQVLKMTQRT